MKCLKIKKINDDGAALIIAIVTVTFITILTTVLLYLSVMNYEMKTTDYNSTVTFYGAEVPLEELKAQLAVDVSAAAEKAYKHVLMNYSLLGDATMRTTEYQNAFFKELQEIWKDRRGATDSWVVAMDKTFNYNTAYDVLMGSILSRDLTTEEAACPYHIYLGTIDPTNPNIGIRFEMDAANGRIFLRDVGVVYTEKDFVSLIKTDFCITAPELNWGINLAEDPAGGMDAEQETRKEVFFKDCVSYLNWEKQ